MKKVLLIKYIIIPKYTDNWGDDYYDIVKNIDSTSWTEIDDEEFSLLEKRIYRHNNNYKNTFKYKLIELIEKPELKISELIEEQLTFETEEKKKIIEKAAKAAKAKESKRKTELQKKEAQLAKIQKELEKLKSNDTSKSSI